MEDKKIQNIEKTAFDIIRQSTILETSDFDALDEIKEELVHNFKTVQIYRTRTEMEFSVLDDIHFPTSDAKYWQCVREQDVHFEQLVILSYDYRKNLVEIRRLQNQLETKKKDDKNLDRFDLEIIAIEIERLIFTTKYQERVAKDRIREIKTWSEIKAKLIPQLKYGNDNVDKHQLESYQKRYDLEEKAIGNAGGIPERINHVATKISAQRLKEERERNKQK